LVGDPAREGFEGGNLGIGLAGAALSIHEAGVDPAQIARVEGVQAYAAAPDQSFAYPGLFGDPLGTMGSLFPSPNPLAPQLGEDVEAADQGVEPEALGVVADGPMGVLLDQGFDPRA